MKRSIILTLISIFISSIYSKTLEEPYSFNEDISSESNTEISTRAGETFTYDGINYQVIDEEKRTCKTKDGSLDGATLIPGNYCYGEVTIPEVVSNGNEEYTVVEIGQFSFCCQYMTKVSLPATITIIKQSAFRSCDNLESIQLPNSLKTIESQAFYNSSIQDIKLSNSVEFIGDMTFMECTKLRALDFPPSCILENDGENLLRGCISLTKVTLPTTLKHLGDFFLSRCSSLIEVTIPEGVETIGRWAFEACSNLQKIMLPSSLKEIGDFVFYDCTSISSINIPANLSYLGYYSFFNCKRLEYINIPESVTCLYDKTFSGCESLRTITLPSSIYYFGEDIFNGCSLTEITYNRRRPSQAPSNLFPQEVYDSAVLRMPYSTLEVVQNTHPWNLFKNIIAGDYFIENDFEYEGIKYTVIDSERRYCETKAGIPLDSDNYQGFLTEIPGNEISGEIIIPEIVYKDGIDYNVTRIGDASFYATKVSSITLPNSVTSIGKSAFEYSDLKTIYLSNALKSIGSSCFHYCQDLFKIDLPDSLESIEIFGFTTCLSLKEIKIPDSCILDDYVFSCCEDLTSVYLPNSMKSLGKKVFEGCESLPEINLPSGLTSIGESCFDGCSSLKKINNTQYLTNIGAGAFSECESLESFILPQSLESVGDTIFANCNNLASVVWEPNYQIPSNILPASLNPNLLLYVNDEAHAPAGFDRTLVVKDAASGNYSCKNLVVTPGYPFYAARNFTSLNSTFTKEFTQETPIEGCAGWETIVLPFDATRVSVKDARGELTPFALVYDFNTQYPFWLFEADSKGDWKDAFGIQAGIPYIISMPNNPAYSSRFNIDGPVTFSNPSPTQITTEATSPYAVTWASGRQFRSLWTSLDEEEAENAMGLNVGIDDLRDDEGQLLPPGSAFHTGVKPKPLEAYVTRSNPQRSFRIRGGDMAGILPVLDDKGLCLSGEEGDLVLRSIVDRNIEIYSASGMLIRRVSLKAGESCVVSELTPGIYIVAGRKIAVR